MKKNLLTIFIFSILFSSLYLSVSPKIVKAQAPLDYSGWVQCDGVLTKGESGRNVKCDFVSFMKMANYLINWAFTISIPVIVGLLAYSGFLYMTGKEENLKRSKRIMQNAVIGFIIMLTAWFIVSTLLKWLVNTSFTGVNTLIEKQ